MIEGTFKVRDRRTGKTYDAFTQALDLNFNGNWVLRWNIGINGYNEWTNICCVYDNNDFNKNYEVVKEGNR